MSRHLDFGSSIGRLGHGLGMQLTEWPSIAPQDQTLLQPGMGLTLEPSLSIGAGRMMVHEENIVTRISEAATLAAILDAGRESNVDAVFASCTNLRTFGILEATEQALGLPVISSNQALAWHMFQLAGVTDVKGPGRLFRH